MPIASLTIDLGVRMASLQTSFDRAAQISEKSAQRIQAAFSGVNTALAGIGAGLSVAGIGAYIKNAIDAADAANDMSQRFGVAVQDLASFDLAARQSGTSLEGVAQGLKAFSKLVVENGDDLRKAGIDTTDTKRAFTQFADVVAGMPDGLEKAALAQQAFGKAGADLIPLLNLGSKGLQEAQDKTAAYAAKLAQLAPQADTLNDRLEELKIASSAAAINMATSLIPTLTDVATKLAEVEQRTGSLRGALGELGAQAGTGFLNSWRAVFKDVQVDLARFDLFVQRMKGDDQAVLKTQEHIKRLLTEMDALGGAPAQAASPAQKSADGMASGNTALAEQQQKYQALIDKILRPQKEIKPPKVAAEYDALLEMSRRTAEAYGTTLEKLVGAQADAENSTLDLTTSQRALRDLMADPAWQAMPEPWKQTAIAQTESAVASEKIAADAKRLKDLLDATDSGQLEKMRETMAFLAKAFEDGRIGAEQFAEAAGTALGTIPKQAEDAADKMDQFMIQAARNIESAFADFLFDPFKDGLDGMLKGFGVMVQRMIAQAVAADLSRRLFGSDIAAGKPGASLGGWLGDLAGMFGGATGATAAVSNVLPGDPLDNFIKLSGFAKGGAFGDGEILTSPTLFKFSQGGAFRTGVAGEAGPEAALPLKRMSNGKLGVATDGAGGSPIVIHQHFPPGTPAETRRSAAQGAREALGVLNRAQRFA